MYALIQKATCLICGKDTLFLNLIICDGLLEQLDPIIDYSLVQCSPTYSYQCGGAVVLELVMVVLHELINPNSSNCSTWIA